MDFWRFPIAVRNYQGGSGSSDTSICRAPMTNGPNRRRKLELGCLEISVTPGGSAPVGSGRLPIGVCIYHGGSASSDTSHYRMPTQNVPDRKRKQVLGCLEISVRPKGSRAVGFGPFPIGLSIYKGGAVSSDTSNCRAPMENGPDRKRKPYQGCLAISVRPG